MRLHYYSMDWPDQLRNLGDYLTVPLLKVFGCKVELPQPQKSVLFGIGSTIGNGHFQYYQESPIVVWGAGLLNREDANHTHLNVSYRAVRSELTRDALGLPESIPLGYSSLLFPELVKLPSVESCGTLYVNHCGSRPPVHPDGFDDSLTMMVTEERALEAVAKIAYSSFVASESLHGCILACAYDIPWAPCSAKPEKLSFKWQEWMHYLGLTPLEYSLPATLPLAREWWQTIGYRAKLRDLKPLLEAFPYELENT